MKLPAVYQWLAQENAPRHLLKAIELFGTVEIVGARHNNVIIGWAKEVGLGSIYKADEIPWCGLYIAIIMKRAERQPVKDALGALNWNNFGVHSEVPMLGDVLTFTRKGGGHVGLYVGEDVAAYHVLGGNQGDKVSIVRIAKERISQVRRPAYKLQPLNIRKIKLAVNGGLSTNEA